MKVLIGLITALSIPVMILNNLVGIGAGIWLAILGEWSAVGIGVVIFLVSTWMLPFVLMPSVPLAFAYLSFKEKGQNVLAVCIGALRVIYILGLITLWCGIMLFFFVSDATASNLLPRLLWSYELATGPWSWAAGKEVQAGEGELEEGLGSVLTALFAQLAYITVIILVMFTHLTLLEAMKAFVGVMGVGLITKMAFAILIQNEKKRAEQEFALMSSQNNTSIMKHNDQ